MGEPANPPAFPQPLTKALDGSCLVPSYEVDDADGMTLRDYFAGQVLTSTGCIEEYECDIVRRAYRIADAMLAERAKAAADD